MEQEKIPTYYYEFLSEEESDMQGGVFVIYEKEKYDDKFYGTGIESNKENELLFSILDPLELQQEEENNFTNYPEYTEDQFIKLFNDKPIKMIKRENLS